MRKKSVGCSVLLLSPSRRLLKNRRRFLKVPKRETLEQKVTQELEVTTSKVKATDEVTAVHAIASGACYDLFHQLLADDPQVQWDHIVWEVHENNPWTALDGTKYKGLQMKTSELLKDCITKGSGGFFFSNGPNSTFECFNLL